MGKKTVQICDFSKEECDEVYKISIKKPGKTKANNYDLSPVIAQQLLEILNHDKIRGYISTTKQTIEPFEPPQIVSDDIDDEEWLANKQKEIEDYRSTLPKGERTLEPVDPNGQCRHINKTPAKFDSGKNIFYQLCRDCGIKLKMKGKI